MSSVCECSRLLAVFLQLLYRIFPCSIGYEGRSGVGFPDAIVRNMLTAEGAGKDAETQSLWSFFSSSAESWHTLDSSLLLDLLVANQSDADVISTIGASWDYNNNWPSNLNNQNPFNYSFTPSWCSPYNPAEGANNNCLDIKSENPYYSQGYLQQIITNLRLNHTVSYWGTESLTAYVYEKIRRGEPVLFEHYEPSPILTNSPAAIERVQFPRHTPQCSAVNPKNLSGAGPIACDYPPTDLLKLVRL